MKMSSEEIKVDADQNVGNENSDRETDLVIEARALLRGATDYAKRPLLVGRVTRCEIGNFASIAPKHFPPVAYVADRADAEMFARAPELLSALCDEVEALRAAAEDALAYVDDLNEDAPVYSTCQACTQGSTPYRFDQGLCWVHQFLALVNKPEKSQE